MPCMKCKITTQVMDTDDSNKDNKSSINDFNDFDSFLLIKKLYLNKYFTNQ